MRTSYAIVWREQGGDPHAGKLEVSETGLRLDCAGHAQELPFVELAAIRVGRAPNDRLDGRRALVVERRDGSSVQIASVAGIGSLFELTERIASFQIGSEASCAPPQAADVVCLWERTADDATAGDAVSNGSR
jgi:hypothetical protein